MASPLTLKTATATFLFIATLSTILYRKLYTDNPDPTLDAPTALVVYTVYRRGSWIATVREKKTDRVVHETRDYTDWERAVEAARRWVRERAGRFEIQGSRDRKEGDGEEDWEGLAYGELPAEL
jgi:hypothetical protein